jgi:glucose-6-phosphate 1-dehydrogenase
MDATTRLRTGVTNSVVPPCVAVVFGASGDLSARKLMPAFSCLAARGELASDFVVVGVARTPFSDEDFRRFARQAHADEGGGTPDDLGIWHQIVDGFRYVAGDYDDDATFERLARVIQEIDEVRRIGGNRLHYLAIPPSVFPTVVAGLGRHGLNRPPPRDPSAFVRIVFEKPYGQDLRSAQELDEQVHRVFEESQVYRIDHYLGKESVQNLLALRFANTVFEPIWNRTYVDSIEINVAEADGVGRRASFYEQTGALRDIVQNHVMQILALTLMEPPASMDPDAIRDEKVKALRTVQVSEVAGVPDEVVRAQYTEGWVGGDHVPGYRDEPGVSPTSPTETYVALGLRVDSWRWARVPVRICTGKRLPQRLTEVVIRFQPAPHVPFRPDQTFELSPNMLVVRIQPDDGVTLLFGAKVPGRGFDVRSVSMEFLYGRTFPDRTADGYERLLIDALVGDPTLFTRSDEVMQAWRILAPVQQAWAAGDVPLAYYPAGSWRPKEADKLLVGSGRPWHAP